MKKQTLTAARLRELLRYDANTGLFTWISGPKAGQQVTKKGQAGYVRIYFDGKLFLAHRLAWLYVTGEHPRQHIDHINRVRDDNRIVNLRDVSTQENSKNRAFKVTDFEEFEHNMRVEYLPPANRTSRTFSARAKIDGKEVKWGLFHSYEDADAVCRKFAENI